METWEIKGHILEYIEDTHTYICDGVILPSITQIIKYKFKNKYSNVSETILAKASEKGTEVHKAIENYEKYKIEDVNCVELRNYKFLKRQYCFDCLNNEVPIILFIDQKPFAAGRLDLELLKDNLYGLGDIKRTATLDKDYLAYQLNLYRIGFQQCYDIEISFLYGLHLRENVRKCVNIPINEKVALDLIYEYIKESSY